MPKAATTAKANRCPYWLRSFEQKQQRAAQAVGAASHSDHLQIAQQHAAQQQASVPALGAQTTLHASLAAPPAPQALPQHQTQTAPAMQAPPATQTTSAMQATQMPRTTIYVCQTRIHKALSPTSRMYLVNQSPASPGSGGVSVYTISGDTGTKYTVKLEDSPPAGTDGVFSCTCQDYRNRQVPCKHLYWIMLRVLRAPVPSSAASTWSQFVASKGHAAQAAPLRPQQTPRQPTVGLANVLAVVARISAANPTWKVPSLSATTECVICLDTICPLAATDKVHWCRFQCGNPIHEKCGRKLVVPVCPACRNPKFYMNVARYGYTG